MSDQDSQQEPSMEEILASIRRIISEEVDEEGEAYVRQALNQEREEAERVKAEGRIMIGLVGHPNVGKSSMVNSILRRKAVSVKATPGARHTRSHFSR